MKVWRFFTAIGAITIAAALPISHALADEDAGVTFVTSIGVQNKTLKFDQKYKGPAPQDNSYADFEVNLPVGNISFTTSFDKFFVALKYEKSLTESSTGADETNRIQLFGDANLLTVDDSQMGVEREDKSITLGYNVYRGLNVFMGYMEGETELKPDPMANCIIVGPNCFVTDINKAYIIQKERADGRDIAKYKQTYTEEGPYIGFSYAWRIAEAGTLSASYAYADMDGEYKDNANCVIYTCTAFKWEGDTTGSSIGLTWTAPLGENSSYFLDLRQQKYSMDGKDKTGSFPNQSVDTDETMQGITAGVQFYF